MQNICIIIPCYNEEKRLQVGEFQKYIESGNSTSFCFVNDGSTDNTSDVLIQIQKAWESKVYVINLSENKGKAEAVRAGITEMLKTNKYDIVGYLDADLATPLEEISLLYNYLKSDENYLVAFGSRIKRIGTEIIRKPYRHYLGRIFSTYASIILHLPVYDTQCGAKIFKKEIASRIFTEKFISRWLFDVEIFARITNIYGVEKAKKIMIEVPLNKWQDKGDSKITIRHMIKVPFELRKIKRKYKQPVSSNI